MLNTLPNGLHLKQITVPFGVVGMVYEARPNVTVDAAVILIRSGNAALLRGSSSAENSNQILVKIMRDALAKTNISPDVLQLIPATDRATTKALLNARGEVDLVIPRGSAGLIRMVVDEATVPTIETGAGVCHVYVDKDADQDKAIPILINSKTHRPSVCNAAGIPIAGGHTIDSVEPIYGLVVLGLIHPDRVKRNDGARKGDVMVLGKPIGVGSSRVSPMAHSAGRGWVRAR